MPVYKFSRQAHARRSIRSTAAEDRRGALDNSTQRLPASRRWLQAVPGTLVWVHPVMDYAP